MHSQVSILLPMRNAERYIGATIQSLLNQTYTNFEIIVINDGSTDASQSIVEAFDDARIKIFQGDCKGISAALNKALNESQGAYVSRCDADDIYPSNRLQTQVDWLRTHNDYIAVAGKFSNMDEDGTVISEYNTGDEQADITSELLGGVTRTHLGSFLIQSRVVKALKGFREYFVTAEDIDMQLRLAECGSIYYLPQNVYLYRIHQSSITHVQSSNKRLFFENTARTFLQQRINDGEDMLDRGNPPTPPVIEDSPSDSINQLIGYALAESWRLHRNGEKFKAHSLLKKMIQKKPSSWVLWKNLLLIWVK